jgi:Tfp pilus assembly protein PilF
MRGNFVLKINKPVIHLLVIIIFATLSYSNTFDVPFQMDDGGNIVRNPAIKKLSNFVHPETIELTRPAEIFNKPLFEMRYVGYFTFALNYAVHGFNVWGYHLVNLLIHLSSSLLVYCLITLTFKTACCPKEQDSSTFSKYSIAFFSALLFAVHPIQTQAVTYIVQRFASLATMFWLLSLVCYVQCRLSHESSGIKRAFLYFLSLTCAVLAMKTKEFALLLPIVIILYELMFLEGSIKKRAQYLIPLFLSLAVVPLSLMRTANSGLTESAAKISGAFNGISRLDYLFTQFRVIVTYFRLLFFPVNQRFDYDYPIYRSFFTHEVVLSLIFLILVFSIGVYTYLISRSPKTTNRLMYRLIAFGLFWFFITLSAESSIIPIADVIFEHRLYLPSIGFIIAFVSAIELVRTSWARRVAPASSIFVIIMMMLATGLSAATYARNSIWRDPFGLLEDEVKKSPGKDRPRYLLGIMYGEQGRMAEAVHHLKIATTNNPRSVGSHYSLAITYMRMGELEEATNEYRQAIALKFDFADAHTGLAGIYAQQGRNSEALNEYLISLRVKPDSAETHYNLGTLYMNLGQKDEAQKEFQAALLCARQKFK